MYRKSCTPAEEVMQLASAMQCQLPLRNNALVKSLVFKLRRMNIIMLEWLDDRVRSLNQLTIDEQAQVIPWALNSFIAHMQP